MPKLPPLATKLIYPKFWNKKVLTCNEKANFLKPYSSLPKYVDESDFGKSTGEFTEEPGFLTFVLNFIKTQNNRLDEEIANNIHGHFQVYKEAFEWIIEAFNTYKPILAAIKREYDLVLDSYIKILPDYLNSKDYFHTLSQHGTDQVVYNHKMEKKEIDILRKEKRDLRKELWSLTNDLESVECQINFLEEEIVKEKGKLLIEDDKRKNLVTENINLKTAAQTLQSSKSGEMDVENFDKLALYNEYLEIKSEHKRISTKLRKLSVDYMNNVSKSKYKVAMDEFMKLASLKTSLKNDIDQMKSDLQQKKTVFTTVEKEKTYYYYKCQQMKYKSGFMLNIDQFLDILNQLRKCFEHVTDDDLLTSPDSGVEMPPLVLHESHSTSTATIAYRHLLEIVIGMPPGTASLLTPEFLKYITDTGKRDVFHDPFNLQITHTKRKPTRAASKK